MISDSELAAAVEGRAHWRPTGEDSAVFEVPGQPGSVRVGRIRRPPRQGPTRHDRYFAALIRGGRAVHAASFGFASEAVILYPVRSCDPRLWLADAEVSGRVASKWNHGKVVLDYRMPELVHCS